MKYFIFFILSFFVAIPSYASITDIDEYDAYVSHFNGLDNATNWLDEAYYFPNNPFAPTAFNHIHIETSDKKFGVSSIEFDGTTDYFTLGDSSNWEFGTGNFTIDFWAKLDTLTNYDTFIGQWDDTIDSYSTMWKFDIGQVSGATSKPRFNIGCATRATQIAYDCGLYNATNYHSIDTNWHHWALIRNGTDIKIYFDGTSIPLTATVPLVATSSIPNVPSDLYIGFDRRNSSRDIDGFIDELRISKGIARWTENFTPPTIEYVLSSSTEETSSSTLEYGDMPIFNDIGIITGFTQHFESSTTMPDWTEKHYYHIPWFIWILFWLIFSFIFSKILSILFAKYGN